MSEEKFIDVRKIIKSKNPSAYRWIPGFIIRYLERILHQKEINQFLLDHKNDYNLDFCEEVIKMLNVQIELKGLEKIPTSGKIVIAMNHSLGGLDAMALASSLKGHREDLKFIVNDILLNLKNLNGIFIGVNKHGSNSLSKREQLANLFATDQAICIFPAGLVSRKINGKIVDLEWKKTFITMSKKHNRTIIPIFIEGKLSNFFYRLSNFRKKIGIKANIEMLYLSHEFFKLRNQHIRIIVGDPIPFDSLPGNMDERKQALWVRNKVYELQNS